MVFKDKLLFIAPDLKIKEMMNKELESDRIQELLKRNSLGGEYRELITNFNIIYRFMTIDTMNMTHLIRSFRWDDMRLLGDIELLESHKAYDSMKSTMEWEIDIGWFMPRLLMSDRFDTSHNKNIFLITFDYSAPPSHVLLTENYFAERCKKLFE